MERETAKVSRETPRSALRRYILKSLFNFEGPGEIYGGIAQLGEHLLCKQGVSGSIPLISTKGLREAPKPEYGKRRRRGARANRKPDNMGL